mgnify:FL=1
MRFFPSKTSVTGGLRIELVIIIGGLIASAHASMMIVIPVMPRFIELIGGAVFVFGLAFTLYAVGRFLTNIPAGALSEIIGRKWVVTIGALGVALFAFLSGIPDDVPLFLLFRFLSGVFSSMTIVVGNIIAADLSTVDNRGRVLGLMQGMQLVVGTGSPAIGGLIGEVMGTRYPFYVSGFAVLFFALWAVFRLPETKPDIKTAPSNISIKQIRSALTTSQVSKFLSKNFFTDAKFLLRDSSFMIACILGFSTFFLRGGMSTTLIPIYADGVLKMGPGAIGILFTFSSFLHGVLIYPAGAIADRWGRKIVIVPAGLVVGISILGLPFSQSISMFVFAFILLHIGQGWGSQAPVAYVADLAPPSKRGVGIGLFRTFGDFAGIIGPIVSTSLLSISFTVAFGFNAILWTVSIIAFAFIAIETGGRNRKRGPIDEPEANKK